MIKFGKIGGKYDILTVEVKRIDLIGYKYKNKPWCYSKTKRDRGNIVEGIKYSDWETNWKWWWNICGNISWRFLQVDNQRV